MNGSQSFSEISRGLPRLSDKVLTDRLNVLVSKGLVRRQTTVGFPSRVCYQLTPSGLLLRPLLIELYNTGILLQEKS